MQHLGDRDYIERLILELERQRFLDRSVEETRHAVR